MNMISMGCHFLQRCLDGRLQHSSFICFWTRTLWYILTFLHKLMTKYTLTVDFRCFVDKIIKNTLVQLYSRICVLCPIMSTFPNVMP